MGRQELKDALPLQSSNLPRDTNGRPTLKRLENTQFVEDHMDDIYNVWRNTRYGRGKSKSELRTRMRTMLLLNGDDGIVYDIRSIEDYLKRLQ